VFGHVPLFAVPPEWGWTTGDGTKAIAMLRRFSAATVLNGHIHQIVEHTDGAIRFATAPRDGVPPSGAWNAAARARGPLKPASRNTVGTSSATAR